MKQAVIAGAARTPIGSFLGGLSSISATSLGSTAIVAAMKDARISPELIDEVIAGQVLQGGAGQAPARQAALGAKIATNTPCTTINKVCGSGMKAVMMAAQSISISEHQIVVAGGMESMSNAPYLLPNARQGYRMGDTQILDLLIKDGLLDPYKQSHMGKFGELCAKEHGFSREAQDNYAHESYQKAHVARKEGWVKNEIAPVTFTVRGKEMVISEDEEPNRYIPEKFASLKPAFDQLGTITAANASKVSDGAAFLVIADEDFVKSNGLNAKARIVAQTSFAHDPEWFTTAPVQAIKNVLNKASLTINDIGCFEINEAFSVVPMHAIKELSIDPLKVNIFGGAIALGHPIGCSGARVLVTLLNIMKIRKIRYGCASLCIGGGEAVAMVLENTEV